MPSIQQSLHLNEAQLGAALFAMPIGLMATMPITSRLLATFSSSRIMIIGAVAFNTCLLGFSGIYPTAVLGSLSLSLALLWFIAQFVQP